MAACPDAGPRFTGRRPTRPAKVTVAATAEDTTGSRHSLRLLCASGEFVDLPVDQARVSGLLADMLDDVDNDQDPRDEANATEVGDAPFLSLPLPASVSAATLPVIRSYCLAYGAPNGISSADLEAYASAKHELGFHLTTEDAEFLELYVGWSRGSYDTERQEEHRATKSQKHFIRSSVKMKVDGETVSASPPRDATPEGSWKWRELDYGLIVEVADTANFLCINGLLNVCCAALSDWMIRVSVPEIVTRLSEHPVVADVLSVVIEMCNFPVQKLLDLAVAQPIALRSTSLSSVSESAAPHLGPPGPPLPPQGAGGSGSQYQRTAMKAAFQQQDATDVDEAVVTPPLLDAIAGSPKLWRTTLDSYRWQCLKHSSKPRGDGNSADLHPVLLRAVELGVPGTIHLVSPEPPHLMSLRHAALRGSCSYLLDDDEDSAPDKDHPIVASAAGFGTRRSVVAQLCETAEADPLHHVVLHDLVELSTEHLMVMPNTQRLSVFGCGTIRPEMFEVLCGEALHDDASEAAARRRDHLRALEFAFCGGFGKPLALHLVEGEEEEDSGTSSIPDGIDTMTRLAEMCSNVTEVSLAGVGDLSAHRLLPLAQGLKGLTRFEMRRCRGVTTAELKAMFGEEVEINVR